MGYISMSFEVNSFIENYIVETDSFINIRENCEFNTVYLNNPASLNKNSSFSFCDHISPYINFSTVLFGTSIINAYIYMMNSEKWLSQFKKNLIPKYEVYKPKDQDRELIDITLRQETDGNNTHNNLCTQDPTGSKFSRFLIDVPLGHVRIVSTTRGNESRVAIASNSVYSMDGGKWFKVIAPLHNSNYTITTNGAPVTTYYKDGYNWWHLLP